VLNGVYAQLLKVPGARRYLARALAFLEQNGELSDNHDLFARLIEMQPDYDLNSLVRAWLDKHPYDPGRYSVIGALLTHPQFKLIALKRALEELAGPPSAQRRYLFAMAVPVVQAMATSEVRGLAETLSPRLNKSLQPLVNYQRGSDSTLKIHRKQRSQ